MRCRHYVGVVAFLPQDGARSA
eukprot:COSAG02_NODE_47692_length_339_cov_0.858333_2_plen_21_part_01